MDLNYLSQVLAEEPGCLFSQEQTVNFSSRNGLNIDCMTQLLVFVTFVRKPFGLYGKSYIESSEVMYSLAAMDLRKAKGKHLV